MLATGSTTWNTLLPLLHHASKSRAMKIGGQQSHWRTAGCRCRSRPSGQPFLMIKMAALRTHHVASKTLATILGAQPQPTVMTFARLSGRSAKRACKPARSPMLVRRFGPDRRLHQRQLGQRMLLRLMRQQPGSSDRPRSQLLRLPDDGLRRRRRRMPLQAAASGQSSLDTEKGYFIIIKDTWRSSLLNQAS